MGDVSKNPLYFHLDREADEIAVRIRAGGDPDELLTAKKTAGELGVSVWTLAIWRNQGVGPPYLKLGDYPSAPVRYKRSTNAAWLESRTFAATSDYAWRPKNGRVRTRPRCNSCTQPIPARLEAQLKARSGETTDAE